jgi:hypothetical protein
MVFPRQVSKLRRSLFFALAHGKLRKQSPGDLRVIASVGLASKPLESRAARQSGCSWANSASAGSQLRQFFRTSDSCTGGSRPTHLLRGVSFCATPPARWTTGGQFDFVEAERLLGWPQVVCLWFDPWLPVVMILVAALTTFALPWIVGLFRDPDHHRHS